MIRSPRFPNRKAGGLANDANPLSLLRKIFPKFDAGASTLSLVKRGVRDYTRRHWRKIAVAVLLMTVASAGMGSLPLFLKEIFRLAIEQAEIGVFLVVVGLLLAAFLVRGLANLGQEAIMSFVGNRIVADIQSAMFAHVMRADLAYFHNTGTGTLISNFINDTTKMRAVFSTTITGIGRDALSLVFLVAVMIYQDWLLTCIVFFIFPLVVVPVALLGERMRRVSKNTQIEMAQFTTRLDESFQGARHVKAYGMEAHEAKRADGVINTLFKLNFKATLVRALAEPILEMVAGVAVAVLLVYAAFQVSAGGQGVEDYLAFLFAFLLAYEPVRKLSRLYSNLQEGLAAAERVFRTLDMQPEIVEKPGARPLAVSDGAVTLDRVSFAYHPGAPALREATLTVPAGKTVALVGPSGAGKSTVLNLIPRFYDVDDGRVLIDGQDVRDVTFASLRGSIGLVSQETSLFDDSIRANIAYGKPDATEEEIVAAAQAAEAHDFIIGLPNGYDTEVGGLGVKLSGGQRQRVSIARAILKNAPILLLDEATSALDTESERKVQAALTHLMRGRTVIVIAHRLSTIVDADLIYVLDGGRVIESGSHDELLARGGTYAGLYATQFGNNGTPAAGAVAEAAGG